MGKYDWNELAQNLQKDALSDGKKKYETDSRFYKLSRNDNDTGGALVRLLPDPEGVMFAKMQKISANKGHEKRFCNEWSPQSIGLPDPFNERWQQEWNAGNKEEAKRFGRSFKFISNIKVLKDPANPENEGKIFLLEMSQTIFEKVRNAAEPSSDEVALGAEPKEVYDPLDGNSFLMKVKRGANNFITYEDSKFDEKTTGIYKTDEEFQKDIQANGYKLNDFHAPEFFKTYDELMDSLLWYTNEKTTSVSSEAEAPKAEAVATVATVETVETVATVETVEPKTEAPEADDLDALLDDLM